MTTNDTMGGERKVDVLAVMRGILRDMGELNLPCHGDNIHSAIVAIKDLIEENEALRLAVDQADATIERLSQQIKDMAMTSKTFPNIRPEEDELHGLSDGNWPYGYGVYGPANRGWDQAPMIIAVSAKSKCDECGGIPDHHHVPARDDDGYV